MFDLVFDHADANVYITELANGKRRVSVVPRQATVVVAMSDCETSYPQDLIRRILEVKGPAWLCDEITREEDPARTGALIEKTILAYVSPTDLHEKSILDFGCGAGSSTMSLARLFPTSRIVGTDFEDGFLDIARLRALHYGYRNVSFVQPPHGLVLPLLEGPFDFIVLCAVYEHLLPRERQAIFPQLWGVLKPRGVMFLMETPNRYWLVEGHTTRLPMVNFLPDRLALAFARRFSKRVSSEESWEALLRRGVRGGSVRELVRTLSRNSTELPVVLEPSRGAQDRIDLCWFHSRHKSLAKRLCVCALKTIKHITSICYVPDLELAIRKGTKSRSP